ncbi:MAG TPA: TonB-dependent receptor [Rhodocyclaceae bacterium]|nr:TonB-dependent receptor [Rhodocyclaceae bacterium]
MKPCKALLAIAPLLTAPTLQAAEEDLYFSSLPVVASVSRLPQPLSEAPGAVTVIDREMIRSSGARNFADLLRLVPGFQVTPPNQEGAVVAYHGLSNEEYTPRVQVLVDGRSLYSPLFRSGVNWNLLPVALDDIERVEVLRGSNSVAYGSNAFLGVINIITVDASQAKGWLVSANHGNQSVRDETVRWGGRIGAAHMRLTYQQQGDDGFRRMFDGGLGWFDPHDSRHAKLVDLRADIPLSERDELRLSLGQASDISQFGRPNSLSDPFRDLSQSSTFFSTEWRRALANGDETKLRFSHVEDWSSGRYLERVSFNDPNNAPVVYFSQNNTGGKSASDELEFQHILSPWQPIRIVWGAGLQDVALTSQYQFFTTGWKRRTNTRLFGNLEWRPDPKWLLNFGSSAEHDSVSGDIFDPRVSVSYHVTPGNTLRLVASRSHRAPSLYEALGDTRKTPVGAATPVDRTYLAASGLKPERIDTLEAGYLGEFQRVNASVDVRWFHERIPNRIAIIPYPLAAGSADSRDWFGDRLRVDNAAVYPFGRADAALNMEQVSIQGYEYQWQWRPFDATRLIYGHAYIRTFANLTDLSAIADVTGETVDKISRQTRESAPRHSTSAMVVQRLPYDLEASVMYYKVGYMRWLRNSYTNPYERLDWRLARPFRIGSTRAEVAYTAQRSNGPEEGRRYTRVATETHWLSLRLEY